MHVVLDLMRCLNMVEHVTFVLVTHDPEVASVARQIVCLHDGRIVSDN